MFTSKPNIVALEGLSREPGAIVKDMQERMNKGQLVMQRVCASEEEGEEIRSKLRSNFYGTAITKSLNTKEWIVVAIQFHYVARFKEVFAKSADFDLAILEQLKALP